MIDLTTLTLASAREKLDNREFSAVDLASAYLKEIELKNVELNAYLEVFTDVLEQARRADEIIKSGKSYPLLGIPLAIKDNILISGKTVSASSKMLENYTASYDATIVKKLKSQGAIILGRTNMDEFALGGSTENSAFGVTRNPHDTTRVPGGTSGGSAAVVSAGLALAAIGTDTGGSIRLPASFCGVTGLKPTYGMVSRHGLIAAVSSFDVIGPITKTVEDAEILFNAMKGGDGFDNTSRSFDTSGSFTTKDTKVIGVPWDLVNQEGINEKVKENFEISVKKFEALGYRVQNITLPNFLALYYIINFAEVSTNLSRFDGVRYGLHRTGDNLLGDYLTSRGEGFGAETRRRILLGAYVLSAGYFDAYYGKAEKVRSSLKKQFNDLFKEIDFILTPTSPVPAWKIGDKGDPLSMYLVDIFTVTANIVGIPAISVPSGFMQIGDKYLPLGIQFMATHGAEDSLFEIGKNFETI